MNKNVRLFAVFTLVAILLLGVGVGMAFGQPVESVDVDPVGPAAPGATSDYTVTVSISPTFAVADPAGGTQQFQILFAGVPAAEDGLGQFGTNLQFDHNVIDVVEANQFGNTWVNIYIPTLRESGWLGKDDTRSWSGGAGYLGGDPDIFALAGNSTDGGTPGPDGDGVAALYKFECQGEGVSALTLVGDFVANPDNDQYNMVIANSATMVCGAMPTYTLTTNVVGQGSVLKDPDQAFYELGTDVDLTAVPAAHHWPFVNWSGVPLEGSTDNPATITMNDDYTVTAHFVAATTYTVDVGDSVPPEGGTVDVEEQWDDDLDVFEDGETITVTATAAQCYKFAGWTGSLIGEPNPAVVPVNSNMTFAATFTVMTSTLSVNVAPTEAEAAGAMVDITPDQTVFECGATVTATAVPTEPWSFKGWDGALMSEVSPDSFVIGEDAATVLTGTFADVYIVTIQPTDTITGGGYDVDYDPTECTPIPEGYKCDPDSVITFTAQADHCYEFAGWLGDIGGVPTMTNPLALTVVANVAITPTFSVIQFDTLTVVVEPAGKGTAVVDPATGPYICGQTTVTATATPTTTWNFNRWTGAVESIDNPAVFTMGEEQVLTAHFKQYKIYLPIVMRNYP